ncbi:DUF2845 domain-containing protein [Methylonatrum kenyense]
MVREAWGTPTRTNRTNSSSGIREQWIYRYGPGRANYVYLENGRVTSIQN